MRPLGLTDTVFYNLGDCYIAGVSVLDGPCDVAVLLAEFEGVLAELPALAERPVRLGLWSFARNVGPIDLTKHVSIVRDASIRSIEQVVPRLDRLRRSRIALDGPPWRVMVLNPAEPGRTDDANAPLSAIYLELRHGLADAMRGLQILGRMVGYEATAAHREMAARLPVVDPGLLTDEIEVHDVGLSVIQVPRRAMSRDGDASVRLSAVAAAAVSDPALFPNALPLRGNIGRTRLVRRRGPANGLGNHMKMMTVKTGVDAAARRRFRIPGLSRAQDLPLSQWFVAVAPRRLARLAMRIWYSSFDAIATLVPLPRRLQLGGRLVTAVFGVPPLWGPVPLVLVALAGAEDYHVTVIPGRGFTGDRKVLLDRLRRLFGSGIDDVIPAPVPNAERAQREDRRSPVFAKGQ